MISLFTDRYKLTLILASIFIVGVGYSLYSIYSLPNVISIAGLELLTISSVERAK